jgi:hypothetical protein
MRCFHKTPKGEVVEEGGETGGEGGEVAREEGAASVYHCVEIVGGGGVGES